MGDEGLFFLKMRKGGKGTDTKVEAEVTERDQVMEQEP